MTFQPGQSGNPNGRPKGRVSRRLFEEWSEKNEVQSKCQETLAKAAIGQLKNKLQIETARYLLEQIIGKAPQSIEHSTDSDQPFQIQIIAPATGILANDKDLQPTN